MTDIADDEPDDKTIVITVWNNFEGDIIEKLWEATWEDYDRLLEKYRDDPFVSIVIDEP